MHVLSTRMATIAATLLMQSVAFAAQRDSSAVTPGAVAAVAELGLVADYAVTAHPILARADLESWLDGFLPHAIRQGDVAGAVVVVVKDEQVLLQKGYGLADVENAVPVDPERTLFRTGSVSKLFTWTAVMQLVERGKLDLDRDINAYLDFQIPSAFDRPITLRNLMTHTPGFEELLKRLIASDPRQYLPLEAYVKARTPARIFPPGEVPAYSNYGATLAGYIVQRVSGESFDDYLDRHILGPLAMYASTFRQPLPRTLAAHMSRGYEAGSDPAHYFELVGPAPAGALSATGADMARFMLSLLHAESGVGPTLLKPETARVMYETMFRAAPPSNGMALGFFERSRNGRRIIGHAGDTQFFHSDLLVFIDDGVGLFMSFNSTGREGSAYRIREALFAGFADRYFPSPLPEEPTLAGAPVHAKVSSGRYQSSRRADTSFLAVLSLLSQTSVAVNTDGTLTIPPLTSLDGTPKAWREVDDFVWREVGGRERMVAQVVDGRVRAFGLDAMGGIEMLQPVAAWKSSAWIVPVLLGSVAVLLIDVLSWPLVTLVRRHYGVTSTTLAGPVRLSQRLVRVVALVYLLFLVGWLALLQAVQSDYAFAAGNLDPWLALLHVVGMLAVAGIAVAVWNVWLRWKSDSRWASRFFAVVLAVACLAIAWFAITFNLIRFSLDY